MYIFTHLSQSIRSSTPCRFGVKGHIACLNSLNQSEVYFKKTVSHVQYCHLHVLAKLKGIPLKEKNHKTILKTGLKLYWSRVYFRVSSSNPWMCLMLGSEVGCLGIKPFLPAYAIPSQIWLASVWCEKLSRASLATIWIGDISTDSSWKIVFP